MKKQFAFIAALVAIASAFFFAGCTTNQQRVAYNTIYSVAATERAAVVGYFTAVAKGQVSTNGVPAVALKDVQFTAAALAAADASQFGTNALAPASLVILATDIGNFISTLK